MIYSEKKENYLMNAGYIGEQLDLYLRLRLLIVALFTFYVKGLRSPRAAMAHIFARLASAQNL